MNRTSHRTWLISLLAAIGLGVGTAAAGVTNTVPWRDTFEGYATDTVLNDTNGWSSEVIGAGVVAADPLPAGTHTNVLRLISQVCNDIRSMTGIVVTLDLTALPTLLDAPPNDVDATAQYSFYVSTNGHVVIWHQNITVPGAPTNEWLELTNAPLSTGVWTRFTVKQDYSNSMFQMTLNGGEPLTHGMGWSAPGGCQTGSWFHMVQTNGAMARLRLGEDATNYVDNVTVDFGNPAVLTYGTNVFTETVTNNGTVNGTTLSLANKQLNATNGEDMVLDGKVACTNLPAGLGLQIVRGVTAQDATLIFISNATHHALADSVTNLTITFTDNAFVLGNAAAVSNGALANLQIRFADPRVLTYGGSAFTELAGGVIDNRHPMTITLSGDTFAGVVGWDFVARGWMQTNGIPAGLNVQAILASTTQLVVSLTGQAVNNSTNDNVYGVGFTFQDAAFASGNAGFVTGSVNSAIQVLFTNDTGFFNVLPFVEPFEVYPNGFFMAGTNGWSAATEDAGVVTNSALLTAGELAYLSPQRWELPVVTNHTQVLALNDTLSCEVNSEGASLVYLDLMGLPVPFDGTAVNDTNRQFAFYVSTNCQLVIWHRNMTGGVPGSNEWLTLAGVSQVSTTKWTRFTVAQNYSNHMFQMRINEGAPLVDPAGWTEPGNIPTGSWFYMVQTNPSMARLRVGPAGSCVDDVTVRLALPQTFGNGFAGAVFLMR